MKVEFGKTKNIKDFMNQPIEGRFGIDVRNFQWIYCREQFARQFNENSKGFFFSHLSHKSEDVASFILKTEEIIGITDLHVKHDMLMKFNHSFFSKTNKQYAMWIEPSEFWKECPVKRSLLTIFLRCATNYCCVDDNYDEVLLSNSYIEDTIVAVKRFLFGFTNYVAPPLSLNFDYYPFAEPLASLDLIGWVKCFKNKSESDVKRLLVLPKGVIQESNLIAEQSNCLWG